MGLSELRILVLEDHGFQRRLAIRLLAALGVTEVREAADGAAALELLQSLPTPPDVIMVDLDMPGMDGIEFIGHVARQRLARGVALVSALDPAIIDTVQTVARGFGLHVLGSIEKPVTTGKLEAMLLSYEERVHESARCEEEVVDIDELRAALADGAIVPWFQPQVEFANGRVVAVEALARWQRSADRLVGPQQFVPLLEREGLSRALTDSILAQACAWKRRWEADGMRLRISINVFPATLADSGIVDHFVDIVRAHGVEPSEVMLEIMESSLMADHGLSVLARLRLKGFGLAIDDFGTGYSSLTQLSQVPFTELKVDRSFVAGAHQEPRKRAVIEASLDLARKLGLATVAEGVDTVEEWQMLSELGCGSAQGFLVSPAVPGDAIAAAIGRWRRPG